VDGHDLLPVRSEWKVAEFLVNGDFVRARDQSVMTRVGTQAEFLKS
jgi:hypothetical protein